MNSRLFLSLLLTAVAAWGETDWARLNVAAREHAKTPTALEQYDYYTPIDASMGDMIGAFAAAYKTTGNALCLEKAKALADNVTCHQRADGTIPTYFDSRKGSEWVNCMIYAGDRLEALADVMEK